MENLKYPERILKHTLSIPFIYGAAIGFIALDIFIEIYHRICFPLYGLKYVDRRRYFKYDRAKLSYLSFVDRFNCLYCSYGNGLMGYAKEITAQTEKYWCGVKHKQRDGFIEPKHHKVFLEYGDEAAFQREIMDKRECKLQKKVG